MGFLRDAFNNAQAEAKNHNPERAAEIIGHAALEGPGTFEENLNTLMDMKSDNKPKEK